MSSVMIEANTGSGARAHIKAYSSFERYELADYLNSLAFYLPDVAISIERMPTAILTERLIAERCAPKADMIIGWADTAAQSEGLEKITLRCNGASDGYVRPSGFSTAIVVDPLVLDEVGVHVKCWRDLADSRLKGRVVFPDPAVSGAGFLALTTLLQFYGEDEGWDLIAAICLNVSKFPGSAWKPAELTGNGVIAGGVTVRIAATKRSIQAPSLQVVEPSDVTGVEAEVYGGLTCTRHPKVVGEIVDWILSDEALAIFDTHNKTNLQDLGEDLFMVDAAHAVSNRERWLSQFKTLADNH